MRLDLFLKESRLVKRRPKAKEYCDLGLIEINGTVAKAGREVACGDTMLVKYPHRHIIIEVLSIPRRGSSPIQAAQCYRLIEEQQVKDEELWQEEND